jgi:hypothetical protein
LEQYLFSITRLNKSETLPDFHVEACGYPGEGSGNAPKAARTSRKAVPGLRLMLIKRFAGYFFSHVEKDCY